MSASSRSSIHLRPVLRRLLGSACFVAFLFPFGVLAQASPVGPESLRTEERLDQLERSVEELRAALAALRENPTVVEAPAIAVRAEVPAADFDELARRIDLLASELEALRLGEEVVAADRSEHGYGPAASKVYRSQPGVSLGGYGEFLFESFSSTRDDGSASGQRDLSDALRAIVYLGYKFDQNWLFNSEIEFEHAGSEVAVEFAYLDRLWRPAINFRGGHLLVPMGFVNELHEPPVFLGANRPQIERVILPSTWHENGFGVFGEKGNVTYRSYLMNGLDASGFSDSGLRGGRQKGAKALTEDIAWVSRVDYSPIPGFSLGGSLYVGDSGQGATDLEGRVLDVGTTIYEAHAEVRWRGLEARALAARATLDDVDRLDASLGLTGRSSIGDSLEGWYVQAGYDILARLDSAGRQLTPYFRWELFDTQASVPSGYSTNPANDREIFTLGLDYKPIAPIVLKLDYQDIDNEAGTGIDQFNLAVGYIF